MFEAKKKYETKEYIEPEKPTKKIIGTEKENIIIKNGSYI